MLQGALFTLDKQFTFINVILHLVSHWLAWFFHGVISKLRAPWSSEFLSPDP